MGRFNMTPLERAARALWAENGKPYHIDDATPSKAIPDARPDWQRFLPQARAVLQAIREPSDAMVNVGMERSGHKGYAEVFARDVWGSMIDAAVEEEP